MTINRTRKGEKNIAKMPFGAIIASRLRNVYRQNETAPYYNRILIG
jgi:hypothetical protein